MHFAFSLLCLTSRLQFRLFAYLGATFFFSVIASELSACLVYASTSLCQVRPRQSHRPAKTHTHTHKTQQFLLLFRSLALSCYKVSAWLNWDAVYQSYCSAPRGLQLKKPAHISLHSLSLLFPFVNVSLLPLCFEMNG